MIFWLKRFVYCVFFYQGDDLNILEETDVAKYLIFKKEGEDGADVKGGYFDALLVHASQVSKGSEGGEFFP